jgi:hypothetical protein
MLGQLEPDGLPGLPLAHNRAVDGLSMRSNVLDLQADHVATAQLAVDRQVEYRQVACSPLDLELGPDRPDVLRSEWRLRSDQLALIPGCRLRLRGDRALVILHGASPLLQRITSMRYFEPIGIATAFEPMQSEFGCTGGPHGRQLTHMRHRRASRAAVAKLVSATINVLI